MEEEEEEEEMIIDPSGSKGSAWMVFLVVPPDEITLGEDEFEKQKEREEQGCGERLLNPSSFFFISLSLSLSLSGLRRSRISLSNRAILSPFRAHFHVHSAMQLPRSLPRKRILPHPRLLDKQMPA